MKVTTHVYDLKILTFMFMMALVLSSVLQLISGRRLRPAPTLAFALITAAGVYPYVDQQRIKQKHGDYIEKLHQDAALPFIDPPVTTLVVLNGIDTAYHGAAHNATPAASLKNSGFWTMGT